MDGLAALDTALLAAHAAADQAALVGLYAKAADCANDPVSAGFYLTHAYIFALEKGDARALDLRARLVASGRESA